MAMLKHEVVNYRGRDICSCGDQNCAALDERRTPVNPTATETRERDAVRNAYPSRRWATKVNKMSDAQVIAVYLSLKAQHVL